MPFAGYSTTVEAVKRRWLGQYATAEEAAKVAAEARAQLFTYPGKG